MRLMFFIAWHDGNGDSLNCLVSSIEIQIVQLATSHQTTECGLRRHRCRSRLGKVLRLTPDAGK